MDPQTMTDELDSSTRHRGTRESTEEVFSALSVVLQQYGTEGNYSVDRHQWLSELDVKTLVKQIQQAH